MSRGFALVAVLVVMTGALLVTATLLFVTQAQTLAGAVTTDAVHGRALVWSGLQAVMTRLDERRSDILDGLVPEIDDRYEIYEDDGGLLGVVELVPIGPGGELLIPEAGRLDVNRIEAWQLEATELIEPMTAEAVIAHRDGKRDALVRSIAELLAADGVDAETLWGPIEELAAADAPLDAPLAGEGPRGLADVLTVYAHEPALQKSGALRINLDVEWSDELGRRVADRFDQQTADALEELFESGVTIDSEGVVFRLLRQGDVDPAEWPEIVDTFTTDADGRHYGRLDINTAPYETLVALPGVEPDQAAEIVRTRDDLGPDERYSIAWPAIEGILDVEQYETLGGWLTTRSWTYRVRLRAGLEDPDDPEEPLLGQVVYEAVIDLTDPAARVAYLRDVTLLPTAASIAAHAEPDDDLERREDAVEVRRLEDVRPAGGDPLAEDPFGAGDPFGAAGGFGDPVANPAGDPDGRDPSGGGSRNTGGSNASGGAEPVRKRIGRWLGG